MDEKEWFWGRQLWRSPALFITVLMLTLLSSVQTEFLRAIDLISIGVSVFIMYLLIFLYYRDAEGMQKGEQYPGK